MRFLFTCVPGHGHLHPMVPLARALEAAGQEVALATAKRFCQRVARVGFTAFPAGLGRGEVMAATLGSPGAAPLGSGDGWRFGAHMFAAVAAPAKVPDLVAVIRRWGPDLVIHDVTDFAGPVAAASTGRPWAAHSLGPIFPLELSRLAGHLVAALWAEWNVEPGPLGGMFRHLYLDICPPSLQHPDIDQIGDVARPLRPVPFDAGATEALPAWVDELPPRPTVYATLGTVDNHAPGVIEAVVEGLRDDSLNLVVTVGPDRDPSELGPQPANVHVERYIPQSLLLPGCHAVVTHGGSGTILAALAHGLPLLVVPQGANQYRNAERCVAVGAALRLLPDEVTPEAVRRAVTALLGRPAQREAARRLAREISLMPGPEEGAALVEELARRKAR
ncbi:MAG: glycosyltransferase [Actinomycetota bacterium]|nr:glycosyltransferase [Actinomycetota bacterium]